MNIIDLKPFLDAKAEQYNQPDFIPNDPICIPHLFSKKQDIEIMGFWAAVLAWGQRKTIINKCNELISLMDGAPHQFITQHEEKDLKRFLHFKHRTFNATDTLYFIEFFKHHYAYYESLEQAFIPHNKEVNVEVALNHFQTYFFSLPDYPHRTRKHVTSPNNKSTCKRLNMFLRWMVRKDDKGVDFGIWNTIQMKDLLCPLDLHVERVARKLGLITRKQVDWLTTLELSQNLRQFDPADPARYDFALFGLGIEEKF
ncbi:TIGR02757 family protein [Solitalea canadensis]|uniref:TIGR02757 family protein n=1 Tax=Solitalea canadensis (strain ATCC 29591 / DSM 3403 / JCM 21819 / LMG 8368 / NBRC 15130 / NCIMB 12057 / USAM 9D) TaxID=929556 RepID=H8KU53_SOLCM|nr:TIGR02757 family protein [Solitalea canadensis]AFD07033.1 TIGR02757 family protein [Solitalea canadensis DSM 3403]